MRLLLMLTVASTISVYPANAQTVCRPSDPVTTRRIADLATTVSSTDSTEQAVRDSLRLAATSGSNVSLILDEKTCKQGRDALNAALLTAGAPRRVYVHKIGSFYGVEDPDQEGEGEYQAVLIFDRRWRYVSTLMAL